jgi:hypothetical protein
MSSKWVRAELEVAGAATDRFIIPIILKHVPDLPRTIALRQWLDLSSRRYANLATPLEPDKKPHGTEVFDRRVGALSPSASAPRPRSRDLLRLSRCESIHGVLEEPSCVTI